MNILVPSGETSQGQATFGMANLRRERTGLPFIVFISQKDGAKHDVRVKVSPAPKTRLDEMSCYALRPYRLMEGPGLGSSDEALLQAWIEKNLPVLVDYWDGSIEYTEDAVDALKRL